MSARFTIKVHYVEEIEKDKFVEMMDFIWENCKAGFDCEILDHETGETNWLYAKNVMPKEPLYEDLLLEQREQM